MPPPPPPPGLEQGGTGGTTLGYRYIHVGNLLVVPGKMAFIHAFFSSYSKPTSESQRQVSTLYRNKLHMHDPCIRISRKFKGCALMIVYAPIMH